MQYSRFNCAVLTAASSAATVASAASAALFEASASDGATTPSAQQLREAFRLNSAVFRDGFVSLKRRLRLRQRGFVRSWIDRKQQLALMNEVAFLEMDFEKLAGHLGFHGHGNGIDVADCRELHGHRLLSDLCHHNRNGRRACRRSSLLLRAAGDQCNRGQECARDRPGDTSRLLSVC